MDKIPLSLSGQPSPNGNASPPPTVKTPVAGYLATGFGILGIFGPAILFTPLGFLFSLIAMLRGQWIWGFAGVMLAIGGVLGSPILMGLIGLGTLYVTFDWHEMMKPVYDLIGGGVDI